MFKRTQKTPNSPTEYPTGTVVHAETGWYYINGRFKNRFINRRAMKSWNLRVVESTDAAIAKYVKAKPLGFRDGSLIRDATDGKIYLVSGRKRRLITSPEAYKRLGLKARDAKWVSAREVNIHERGEDIV